MAEQIIQCVTDIQDRRAGIYGSTWIIRQHHFQPNLVLVQYSICSPEDVFSRKKGVAFARSKTPSAVHKSNLPAFVNSRQKGHGVYFIPSLEQLYQTIIRLRED